MWLVTTLLRQYGQSPQVRTQGSKQTEWNLWEHGKHISASPSTNVSRHILQSCEALDTAPSTLLLKTSRCKQSRASWLRPGGFFFGFKNNCSLSIREVRLVMVELPADWPADAWVPTSWSSTSSLGSSSSINSARSNKGLPLPLNKQAKPNRRLLFWFKDKGRKIFAFRILVN